MWRIERRLAALPSDDSVDDTVVWGNKSLFVCENGCSSFANLPWSGCYPPPSVEYNALKKKGMPLYLNVPLFDGKHVCPHVYNLASRFGAINVLFKPSFDFSRGTTASRPAVCSLKLFTATLEEWKSIPASYSRLVLPTALYRSPLSCRRWIPAAVVSGPAPPRESLSGFLMLILVW